jgi:predicted DNA-binding protein (MmcQ/YjbR family)
MDIETLRELILSMPYATESMPFGPDALVYKVANKMFALLSMSDSANKQYLSVKCDPERAIQLRAEYPYIVGAYHMNKKHWNGISYQNCSAHFLQEQIKHSYDLVFSGLTVKEKLIL